MEFSFYQEPVNFCIVRNYYTESEVESIHRELYSMKPNLRAPQETGTAKTADKVPIKKNLGQFIIEPRGPIYTYSRKLLSEVYWEASKKHWVYKWLNPKYVTDDILVSYYENGDYYKEHTDISLITAIYYTWKEPKPFSGGDLYFGNFRVPIENNSLVMFPSLTEHSVTPVVGEGRWAITQFIHHIPYEQIPSRIYFKNFLTVTDFLKAQELTFNSHKWAFIGHSTVWGGAPIFWRLDLAKEQFFIDMVQPILKERGLKIRTIYANGQSFGQDGEFHQDDTRPDTWTLLLYLNDIEEKDIDKWGGSTQFIMDNNVIENQYPVPNTAIMFKSTIFHRGLAPSRDVKGLRVTVTWKLENA